jgi:heme exporter protein CcmD
MTGTTVLWPYIAGSYGVTVAALVILGLQAWLRSGRVRRRLAALEAESPRRRGRPA